MYLTPTCDSCYFPAYSTHAQCHHPTPHRRRQLLPPPCHRRSREAPSMQRVPRPPAVQGGRHTPRSRRSQPQPQQTWCQPPQLRASGENTWPAERMRQPAHQHERRQSAPHSSRAHVPPQPPHAPRPSSPMPLLRDGGVPQATRTAHAAGDSQRSSAATVAEGHGPWDVRSSPAAKLTRPAVMHPRTRGCTSASTRSVATSPKLAATIAGVTPWRLGCERRHPHTTSQIRTSSASSRSGEASNGPRGRRCRWAVDVPFAGLCTSPTDPAVTSTCAMYWLYKLDGRWRNDMARSPATTPHAPRLVG